MQKDLLRSNFSQFYNKPFSYLSSTSVPASDIIIACHVFPPLSLSTAEQNIEINKVNGFNTLGTLKTLVVAK
jgi:hypothetical protein